MTAGPAPRPARPKATPRPGLGARLRTWFLAGVAVTAPIGLTLFIAWQVVTGVDAIVKDVLGYGRAADFPGAGLLIAGAFFVLVGMFAANFIGRWLIRLSEGVMTRTPVLKTIYGALKQILETVLAQQSQVFREVALIEYPRPGSFAIGFVVGETAPAIVAGIDQGPVATVFLPTSPAPTSGFLLFIPRTQLRRIDMSVEDGLKLVVSGGIVKPLELPGVPGSVPVGPSVPPEAGRAA